MVSVTSCLCLGCLDESSESFHDGVVDAGDVPTHDAREVVEKCPGRFLDRIDVADDGIGDPPLEKTVGVFKGGLPVEVPEVFLELPSPGQSGIASAKFLEQRRLRSREILDVAQEEESRSFDRLAVPPFVAPDLVQGVVEKLYDVEAIEGDPRIWKVLSHALLEGGRHVHRGFLQALGLASVLLEEGAETADRGRILATGGKHQPTLNHVEEQTDVVVAFAGGGLVDAQLAKILQRDLFQGLAYMVLQDPPEAIVRDPQKRRRRSYRHVSSQDQGVGLEQKREPAAGACPGNCHLLHAAFETIHSGNTGREKRLVLEEIQVPPSPLDRVMNGAVASAAFRTYEGRAAGEVQSKPKRANRGFKLRLGDQPGGLKTKRQREERVRVHPLHGSGSPTIGKVVTHTKRRGAYFYTALNDAGDSLSEFQPPMWSPAAYGYSAAHGEALQLWWRMDTVLSHHYGGRDAWIHDSTKKIDIVCHSQGCLIMRDALRNARDTSLANPLNHIRKVVSLDSPAFGSAMATQASDLSAAFSSIGQVRHLLLDTAGQLIPQKNVQLGILRLAVPLAGGVTGVVEGYNTCSEALGVPVVSQIAGFDCAELGYLGGWILGLDAAFTDYSWSFDGGLFGPWDFRVRTNTLGYTNVYHLALPGPRAMRSLVTAFADTTRHLSQTSPWIDSLRNSGYPSRPIDGVPVPFSVRYSPTTQHIVDTLGIQVAADIRTYCDEHDDWYTENCDYIQDLITAVLGTNSITSDPTVNQLLQVTDSLQTQWTDQGDVVVEKGSQLMVNAIAGFTPKTGIFDTAGYHYQSAYGVGGAKFVAHMPLPIEFSGDVNGSQLQLNLIRAGASMLGLDIHAALGYDTLAYTQGIQRLPRDGGSVLVPPMTSAYSARSAVVQQLPVQGNFQLTVISGDSLLQGFSVRTDSGAPLLVAAVWDRNQGVYLTALHPDGSRSTKILANGNRPVQVRLSRQGNLFTLTATGYDGLVNSDTVQESLPAQIWLGAVSTPQVAASDTLRPAFAGTATFNDTSALLSEEPWNLVTLVRETAVAQNLSAPAIVLVNKDSRTLTGFSLFYEFQADPALFPVLQSFQGPGTATLEWLGADHWRVHISEPQAVVAPGTLYPSANGFQFQLNYQNWPVWPRRAEWSDYGGSGALRWSDRLQVRDNLGNILTGNEIPATPSHVARTAAVGLARDESLTSSNQSSPVISVANTGGTALSNYDVLWYVRAPVGKTVALATWYVPDAQTSLRSLGAGLWVVDLHFQTHILYPGQSTPEEKIGLNLSDWSSWDRSGNPTAVTVSQGLVPVSGLVVRDSTGRVLWGNLPNLEDTVAQPPLPPSGESLPVSVQIRDENPSDDTWIRPRWIVTNQGASNITGFVLTFPLVVDTSKTVVVAPWYAPDCQVGLVKGLGSEVDTARYVCQNLVMSPGGIWPDQGGAVVGFQYSDGTLWNRLADPFVSSWTTTFTPTTAISVKALQ